MVVFRFWDLIIMIVFFSGTRLVYFLHFGAQFVCSSFIVIRTKNAYKKKIVKLLSKGNLGIMGDSVGRGKERNVYYKHYNRTLCHFISIALILSGRNSTRFRFTQNPKSSSLQPRPRPIKIPNTDGRVSGSKTRRRHMHLKRTSASNSWSFRVGRVCF